MIGYVENGNPTVIVEKINRKLDNKMANIETMDNLQEHKMEEDCNSCYRSIHLKDDKIGKIIIYHLLLDYSSLIT